MSKLDQTVQVDRNIESKLVVSVKFGEKRASETVVGLVVVGSK
jgi:hypothetical protein